jgi:nucleoside-diphosphate-sugar epimerase
MKIFLTGGTGVVGTRAVPALVAGGHDVTAVARSEARAALVRSFGAAPVAVDLFDAEAVAAAVVGHEAVVHLATHIPDLSRSARGASWAENDRLRTEASRHLVDAALAGGAARYVQESICFPYLDAGDAWIGEDAPVDHVGPFRGAAAAEASAARFTAGGGTGVVLRFAQFYAPESSHTRAFNRMLRRRLNPFVGAPGAYMSSIHAEDAGTSVAAAFWAPAGVYNVGDDEPLTRREAGAAAAAALGHRRPFAMPGPLLALGPPSAKLLTKSLRVCNARFKDATGWAPAHPSIRGSWPGRVDA